MHGLLAVKVEKDGRHIDVALAALSQIFNDKSQHNSIGDIFEKDGIMWWTPGNGCSTFTKEVREEFIKLCDESGITAEDWTVDGAEDHSVNFEKVYDNGYVTVPETIVKSSADMIAEESSYRVKKAALEPVKEEEITKEPVDIKG